MVQITRHGTTSEAAMSWERLRSLLLRAGVPFDLFEPVRDLLKAPASVQRNDALDRLATAVEENGANGTTRHRLLPALATGDAHARRLALELSARLPPLDASLIEPLRPLLRDRHLPAAVRLEAAVALTRA